MKTILTLMFLVSVATVSAQSAFADSKKLSVDDALQLALRHSNDLRAAKARANGAEDSALSAGARMLPAGILNEEWQHYDHAWILDFPIPGLPPIALKARDQNDNTFVAGIDQPVAGLFHLVPEYMAANAQADAAKADSRTATSALKENLRNGFLRYFEARDAEGIAQASEKELAEQIDVANAKMKAGTLTTNDVLRLKVAEANAKQQEIAAQAQATVIRAQLLTVTGLGLDDDVEFLEPTALETAAANAEIPQIGQAREQAFRLRPELFSARATAKAADRRRFASLASMLPDADFEADYLRIDGQVFAPLNSYYIGIKASWQFTWGATMFQSIAATRQLEAARAQADGQQDQIAVDVASKLANLTAAEAALDAAKASIASAEEAYRVTEALVSAGSATTTDLLNDESALTTARLNLSRATYERAIAHVSLDRATGKD